MLKRAPRRRPSSWHVCPFAVGTRTTVPRFAGAGSSPTLRLPTAQAGRRVPRGPFAPSPHCRPLQRRRRWRRGAASHCERGACRKRLPQAPARRTLYSAVAAANVAAVAQAEQAPAMGAWGHTRARPEILGEEAEKKKVGVSTGLGAKLSGCCVHGADRRPGRGGRRRLLYPSAPASRRPGPRQKQPRPGPAQVAMERARDRREHGAPAGPAKRHQVAV